MKKESWKLDIKERKRFKFGMNWLDYAETIKESQINESIKSLQLLLKVDDLNGKSFLDIGCGSGIVSLAARKLGAKVLSFDFDKDSVSCCKKLKSRFLPGDINWVIKEGSILDKSFIESLGKYDIVYSWGVLHHTGAMWTSLENINIPLLDKNSNLVIAIYNDQGIKSKFWKKIKKIYNSSLISSFLIKIIFIPLYTLQYLLFGSLFRKNPFWFFINYKRSRGMSIYFDWIDWLGGYPYEVAKPDEINNFYRKKGFILEHIITTNSLGCNQYVFSKE